MTKNMQQPNDNPDQGASKLGFATSLPERMYSQGYGDFGHINGDQAAAALSHATHLSQQLLGPHPVAQTPETAPQQPATQPTETQPTDNTAQDEMDAKLQAMEDKHNSAIEDIKKVFAGMSDEKAETKYEEKLAVIEKKHQDDLAKIRKEIKSALNA